MKLLKNTLTLVLILLAAFVTYEAFFVEDTPLNYFSSKSASSTVYVENGVSGVVTITDPTLHKTVAFNISFYPLETGSGVIVSKNGYIITAFHVIGDPQSNTINVLKTMSNDDIKLYVEQAAVSTYLSNYNPQLGAELSSNQVSQSNLSANTRMTTDLLIQNNLISVKSYKQVIRVKFPSSTGSKPLNAHLVDVGNSGTDNDVALLKVNPAGKNLPVLKISSHDPKNGENIRIYGYPASSNVTQSQLSVTPSTTTGSLISEVRNSHSIIYYKTNASTFPGYSGGPVLNSENEVIGILIYGIQTKGSFIQQIKSKYGLFLSSDYIIQICKKNNVPIDIV
ncbi:S1 family peptidase [Methanobacterium sp.]|uniref:S1 family peptidase n=1 Tax=Methanobacterium sp. TaxID=2164 RepID=UPI003C70672A